MRNGHSKQARTHVKPVGLIALLTIASLMAHLPSRAGEYTSEQSLAQTVAINQPEIQGASLPQPLAAQLVQDMAWRSFVPRNEVRIVRTEEAVLDGCRDVEPPEMFCQAMGLPGWKVTIEAREHRFVYHATKTQGFKLNGSASVSPKITNQVLEEASWRSGLPLSKLKLYWVENKTWNDGCFGLPGIGSCIAAKMPGWQVTVTDGEKQRWVYRTGLSHTVLFDAAASQISKNLPTDFSQGTANAVLQDMSKRTGIPQKELQVVRAERQTWDGCLGVAPPGTSCTRIGLPGWRVVVEGNQQHWVYHVASGRGLKLNGPESLPRSLMRAVLNDVYSPTEPPPPNLQVFWAEQKVWSDSCRGFPASSPGICTPGNFPGWIITTTNGHKRWVYHMGLLIGGSLHSESSRGGCTGADCINWSRKNLD